MNEQITSAAELDALPVGSVVMEGASGEPFEWVVPGVQVMPGVFHRFPDGWYVVSGNGQRDPLFGLGFLTVLYRPDQPQRVQPSAEDVARTLIAHPWPSPFFKDICPTCMAEVKAGPNSPNHAAHQARAVLALFAQQPTVAEVKAEALRERAAHLKALARETERASRGKADAAWSGLNGMAVAYEDAVANLNRWADQIEREARP